MSEQSLSLSYDLARSSLALRDLLLDGVATALDANGGSGDRVDVVLRVRPSGMALGIKGAGDEDDALSINEIFATLGTHPLRTNVQVVSSKPDGGAEGHSDTVGPAERRRETLDRLRAAAGEGRAVPRLVPCRGYEADVAGLLAGPLGGHRVIAIDPRLARRANGEELVGEWLGFIERMQQRRPDLRFVLLGRLQNQALAFLKLSNVLSLRNLGLGLGHELALIPAADGFLGAAGGYATMALFSDLPLAVVGATADEELFASRRDGEDRLGLGSSSAPAMVRTGEDRATIEAALQTITQMPPRNPFARRNRTYKTDVRDYERERMRWLQPGATTARFFLDDVYADQETAFLVWPVVSTGFDRLASGERDEAKRIAERVNTNFPRLRASFPELARLRSGRAMPRTRRFADGLRGWLLGRIDGNILPMVVRDTPVHTAARRAKDLVLGYRRR